MISVTGPHVRIDADAILRQSKRLKSPQLVALAARRASIASATYDSGSDEWSDGSGDGGERRNSIIRRSLSTTSRPPAPKYSPPPPPPTPSFSPPPPPPLPPPLSTPPPLPPYPSNKLNTPIFRVSTISEIPEIRADLQTKLVEKSSREFNDELMEFQRVERLLDCQTACSTDYAMTESQPPVVVRRRKKCFENLINAINTQENIRHSTFLVDKSS